MEHVFCGPARSHLYFCGDLVPVNKALPERGDAVIRWALRGLR